ncbi:unnamed protein product [Linum trigynum]|uniref:Uncharacterized protein n=1 Tax=Linum trigynum TaxID=586398 RepID=A0AAV2FYI6_9ROSI
MIDKREEHDRFKVVYSRRRPLKKSVEEVLYQLRTDVVEDKVENTGAEMEVDEDYQEKEVDPQVGNTGKKCEEDPQEKNIEEMAEKQIEKTGEKLDEEVDIEEQVFEPTVPMVTHYTDPNTTFEEIMQIAHEAATADVEEPPTREEVL